MKRCVRRGLSSVLALALLLSIVTVPAFAALTRHGDTCFGTCFTEGGITYLSIKDEDGKVQVVNPSYHAAADSKNNPANGGVSSYTGEITIPEQVTHEGTTYTVTKIGNNAFYEWDQMGNYTQFRVTKVTLPDTITEIGFKAFYGCDSLETLNIPAGVTGIGEGAFAQCEKLENLVIPAGVTSGLANALLGHPISRELGTYRDPNVTGKNTTYYPHVDSVTFAEDSPYYIENGCLYNGTTLEAVVDLDIENVAVKDGTTKIGEYAAWTVSSIKSISLPDSLTEIGEHASNTEQLSTLIIPEGVTSIGDSAFSGLINSPSATLIFKGETPPTFGQAALGNDTSESLTIIVPETAKAAYAADNTVGSYIQTGDSETKPGITYGLTLVDTELTAEDTDTPAITVPTGANVEVSSSDGTVATAVYENGVLTVTGVKAGTATITAKITLNGVELISKSCTVTVNAKLVPATDITLDKTSLTLTNNATATLKATVTPEDTTDTVTWSSSNPDVATVDENGVVTAKANGTATITAKAGGHSATCEVKVHDHSYEMTYDDNYHWNECDCGDTTEKKAHTWDKGTVTTEPTYTAKGVKTYTCTCGATKTEEIPMLVKPEEPKVPATKVTLSADKTTAKVGDTVTLTVKTAPEGTTDTAVITVSDPSIATVKDNKVTILAPGVVTITAKAGDQTASVKITVDCDYGDGCASKDYKDVPNEYTWYHSAVDYVLSNEIMQGRPGKIFDAGATINRAEMAQILYNMAGQPEYTVKKTFPDVPEDTWYYDAVMWAASEGVVEGFQDGNFRPTLELNRQSMVVMIWRYYDEPEPEDADTALAQFPDADAEDGVWNKDSFAWMVENEYVNGMDGKLAASANSTRAQVAQILMKMGAKVEE